MANQYHDIDSAFDLTDTDYLNDLQNLNIDLFIPSNELIVNNNYDEDYEFEMMLSWLLSPTQTY